MSVSALVHFAVIAVPLSSAPVSRRNTRATRACAPYTRSTAAPVAVTAAESVERLRNWAAGRCLDASRGGIYARGNPEGPKAARRVARPSSN